jgi:predicted  nucleic acid-binding Zn-ribbon protein
VRIKYDEQRLLLESKEKVISEMNHHIESIKRELDAAYASIRYFQERDEEYQEEISMLKYDNWNTELNYLKKMSLSKI